MGFFPTVAVLALLVIGASCQPAGPAQDCSPLVPGGVNYFRPLPNGAPFTPGYDYSCYSARDSQRTTTQIVQVTYTPPRYTYQSYSLTNPITDADECAYYALNPFDAAVPQYCQNMRITCAARICGGLLCNDQQLMVYLPGTGVQPTGFETGLYNGLLAEISERTNMFACSFEYPDYQLTPAGTVAMPQDVVPDWFPGQAGTLNPGQGPSQPGDIGGYYEWKSKLLFETNFACVNNDNCYSPVQMMCQISSVNCNNGVTGNGIIVVGNSQGASIGISAHRYYIDTNAIDSIVSMAGDPRVAVSSNRTEHEQNRAHFPFSDYQYIWNSDINGQIPRAKRVYISGENDIEYFTNYCDLAGKGTTENPCTAQALAVNGKQDNAITVQNLGHQYASGVASCGAHDYRCIQLDGSGYYTLQGRSHSEILDYYTASLPLNRRYTYYAINWAVSCSRDVAQCTDWTVNTVNPNPNTATVPTWVGTNDLGSYPFFAEINSSPLLVPSMTLLVLSLFLIVGF